MSGSERLQRIREATESNDSTLSALRPGNVATRVGQGVASLISAESSEIDPEAYARSATEVYSTTVDVDRPDPDTENFWEEYRNNPIIATQIRSLTHEVFEGGYWLTADDEETERELSEYLNNMGLKAGQTHQPFSELGQMTIIQYMVRGTFFGEKVTDDRGRHVAINPVNSSTLEIYTKPGTNVLVPEDWDQEGDDALLKTTEEGLTAAYVQYDEQLSRWDDREERRFARDQMLHWARRPDIGDVRGNSVVEPVYERARALREKLLDTDLAISMKAWPMILFQLGSPENPWTEDEMEKFMSRYDKTELGPGMYQGVPGDVEINEFAGETPDIQQHVEADIEYIVSGMPGPRYALGAFEGAGNAAAGAHERQYRKLIRSIRRDLENLFTPYLKEVAESWGYDPSGVELHIGRADGEVPPEDVQGSIIRYQSDADQQPAAGTEIDGETVLPDMHADSWKDIRRRYQERKRRDQRFDEWVKEQVQGESENPQNGSQSTESNAETARYTDSSEHTEHSEQLETASQPRSTETLADRDIQPPTCTPPTEELADPRLVSTEDLSTELAETVTAVLNDARDQTVATVTARYGNRLEPEPETVSDEFNAQFGAILRHEALRDTAEEVTAEVVDRTLATLDQDTHYPNIDAGPHVRHTTLSTALAERIVDDVRTLAADVEDTFREQSEQLRHSDRGIDALEDRVTGVWSAERLSDHTHRIVHARIQELINRVKLGQYKDTDGVVGVRVINPCTENSTTIGRDLAGCDDGEAAVAYFSADESLGEQLQEQCAAEIPEGFDPLPYVPPFGYDDRSEYAPIVELPDE